MKQYRYYEIAGNELRIYDAPIVSYAHSVSIVHLSDLAYYRRHFVLRKVWNLYNNA